MHALAKLCIQRPVFATMLIMSLVVTGVFSSFHLGVDLFPSIDIPTVEVIIQNPGASPEAIETEITKKVEDAVNTISQVDELRSQSSEGQSLVLIAFELSKNGDIAAQEVQNRINLIINDLPETAKKPVIWKFDPDAQPVMQVAVSSTRSMRDLTTIADKLIKQRLDNAAGVGEIKIVGGAPREIHVLADPDKLSAHSLTITDVFNALRTQNLELPGGVMKSGDRELTLRATGRITDPAQFEQIAIATRGGYPVRVRDIGTVEDSYEEPRTASRLDGNPTVTLVIAKQSGANSVEMAHGVKERLAEIRKTLPKDVHAEVIADTSIFTEASISNIKHHLITGSILASAIIFLFLTNWRTTLIASLAIPTSIVSAFALMAALGMSLNQITMLALTLMVGIVIDDAIIVLENIFRFMEEKGMGPVEAAIEGTREIGLAVMATTLSLLAVFLPVGFMGGIVGRFMSSFGFTSGFAIAVSLLVSFTMTPMLTSRFVKPPAKHGKDQHSSKNSRIFQWIDGHYTAMLRWAMAHRRLMLLFSALTVLSIVPLFMFVGKNFLPNDDSSQFNVLTRAPEGTSLAASSAIAERIARDVRGIPGVQHTLTTVGSGSDASVNNGTIFVSLTDPQTRAKSQSEIMQDVRTLLNKYPKEIHTGVERVSVVGGNQSNAEVQFYIQGPDLARLSQYSDALLQTMKSIPGVADADSTSRAGKPELKLEINRARAADLGVSVLDIEQAVNTLVSGQVASSFNAGDDQFDVRVRAPENFRSTGEGLNRLTVPSSKRGSVSLQEVVELKPGSGPSSVNRISRQRQVTLTCNVLPGASQAAVLAGLEAAAKDLHMDADYTWGRAGASKELARTGYYFIVAFSLTFIFMYIVLAAQFESFIHPITILLTLPLAIPFGILSLLLAGQTVNIFSGLGLLLLFGIVKKNAILQIDHMNGLRRAGYTRYDAIIQANRDRLRPILMTTIALVAGMLPLVVSNGTGAATNRSIGVLVVGGQSLCLLLTLLAVPVFYSYFEDLAESRFFTRRRVLATAGVVTVLIAGTALKAETRVGITGEKHLALPEVIQMVLTNDQELTVSRINRDIAASGLKSARGVYDPVVGFTARRSRAIAPIASAIGGGSNGKLSTEELAMDPQLTGYFPDLGGSYRFDFNSSRQTSDSTFVLLNPQFGSSLNLAVTQPLWRGLRFDNNRYRIQVAAKNIGLSDSQLKQRLIERVTQAIAAYFELQFACRNLEIQSQAVDLANRQDQSNKRQLEQGMLAPADVYQSQTQIATFEQSLYAAQQSLSTAENLLKTLITQDRTDPLWSQALIPDTLTSDPPATSLDDAVKHALAERPELAQSALALEVNQLDVRRTRELAKPQIDAFANVATTGLAGRFSSATGANPFGVITDIATQVNTLSKLAGLPVLPSSGSGGAIPPAYIGGYGQSLSNLASGAFTTATVGVNFSLPLRNRTAKAEAETALSETSRLKAQRKQVELAIEQDVRNALQIVSSAQSRLTAARTARKNAEDQYASEQRQFQAGTTTVYFVLQRQTELIAARTREVRAESDLGQAAANLDRATASTLEARGIAVR